MALRVLLDVLLVAEPNLLMVVEPGSEMGLVPLELPYLEFLGSSSSPPHWALPAKLQGIHLLHVQPLPHEPLRSHEACKACLSLPL